MTAPVRMGVRASLDPEGRPPGTRSAAGPDGITFAVVHFVDLDDGRRVTTESYGAMSLSIWAEARLADLREELREMIFEDELREVDEELSGEPRWPEMAEVLGELGIDADDTALAALPFVIELDRDAQSALAS